MSLLQMSAKFLSEFGDDNLEPLIQDLSTVSPFALDLLEARLILPFYVPFVVEGYQMLLGYYPHE